MTNFKAKGPTKGTAPYNGKPATMAKVVSLHLEGKRKEALQEIDRLVETGQGSPDVY
jgi:hypothetical protein